MRIITLIENRPSDTDPGLTAEWGLSLHIHFNGRRILLDTGASGAFARNATRLSVDLAAVDAAVLSHHHYDHGGGLRRFFELNARASVHMGQPPAGECWFRRFWLIKRYIGIEPTLLDEYRQRFTTVCRAVEILPDVFLFPDISGSHPRPGGNRALCLKSDAGYRPDEFRHEVVMAIRENGRLVIFTGCSHNGVLNIIETVTRSLPGIPIKALVGGFHMVSVPPFNTMADRAVDIESVGQRVMEWPAEAVWTGHCTGPKAFELLKGVMGERLRALKTGTVIDF